MELGWHADPTGRHQERYHDGGGWTALVRDHGVENRDRAGLPAPTPTPTGPTAAGPGRWAPGPAADSSAPPTSPFGRIEPAEPAGGTGSMATPRPWSGSEPPPPMPPAGPVAAYRPPAPDPVPPYGRTAGPPVGAGPGGAGWSTAGAAMAAGGARGVTRPWVIVAAVLAAVVVVGGGVAIARSGSDGDQRTAVGGVPRGSEGVGGDADGNVDGDVEGSDGDFCTVLDRQLTQLEEKYEASAERMNTDEPSIEDILSGISVVAGLPADIALLYAHLEPVAPPEIRPDVTAIKNGFQRQADEMADLPGDVADDPLTAFIGGLGNALIQSAQLQGPIERVDAYAADHCELSS